MTSLVWLDNPSYLDTTNLPYRLTSKAMPFRMHNCTIAHASSRTENPCLPSCCTLRKAWKIHCQSCPFKENGMPPMLPSDLGKTWLFRWMAYWTSRTKLRCPYCHNLTQLKPKLGRPYFPKKPHHNHTHKTEPPDLHNLRYPADYLPGTFVKILIWQAHFEQIHVNSNNSQEIATKEFIC